MKFLLTDKNVKAGPNAGTLFAAEQSYDGLYFVNGSFKEINCGVTIEIPSGMMVEIVGLYANEKRNLTVVPQRLYGPLRQSLAVMVWNNASGTVKLDQYAPIASIRAYQAPAPAVWTDEAEPQPETAESKKVA